MPSFSPNFVREADAYADAEAFWRRLWEKLVRDTGQQGLWKAPWLRTAYADGTPFRNGDPIFSAISPGRSLGVRVIQYEARSDDAEPAFRIDGFGDEGDEDYVKVLVVVCPASDYAIGLACAALQSWMETEQVQFRWEKNWAPRQSRSREFEGVGGRLTALD